MQGDRIAPPLIAPATSPVLEKELARTPTIPKDLDIDKKIREYDEEIRHAITELSRTDQKTKLKPLEKERFSGAGTVSVTSRIPHSLTVEVDYEAVPAEDGNHRVKATKGDLKPFDKSEFQPPGAGRRESYGTITVSNASPDTRLIIEERAPTRDKTSRKTGGEPERDEFSAKIGDKYRITLEKRFRTTFTITQ